MILFKQNYLFSSVNDYLIKSPNEIDYDDQMIHHKKFIRKNEVHKIMMTTWFTTKSP